MDLNTTAFRIVKSLTEGQDEASSKRSTSAKIAGKAAGLPARRGSPPRSGWPSQGAQTPQDGEGKYNQNDWRLDSVKLTMNEGMTMALPQPGCGVIAAGEALALPAVLAKDRPAKQQMSASAEAVMRTVYDALETLVSLTVERRTAEDFRTCRSDVYPAYYNAVLALPPVIKLVVPGKALDVFVRESFCEMESDLRERGLKFFGSAVRDQALFTVWTLRKITEMFGQIPREKTAAELNSKAAELLKDFTRYGVWTRFHLHCLVTSMRDSKPIFPEPLVEIIDGLRAAVNAYAYARQIVDLISPRALPADTPQEWDEEDAALLSEANMDMLSEEA